MITDPTTNPAIGILPKMPNLSWGEHPLAYHMGFIALDSEITFDLCEEVLSAVYRHHDIIRLRKMDDGGAVTYYVPPETDPFTLHLVDVSSVPAENKDAAVQAGVDELRIGFENSLGPFSLFAYCRYGGGASGKIAVLLDHIVFDNFGLKVLEDHILRGLAQRLAGKPVELPAKTISYREWGLLAKEYVDTEEGQADLRYWRTRPWKEAAQLTADYPSGYYDHDNREQITFALSPDHTRQLLESTRKQHGLQIMDVLLCGLVYALQHCFEMNSGPVSIATILSERLGALTGINTTRSLGNFATVPPVLLDSHGATDPGTLLRTISKQHREMPRGGKTFGWLGEYYPEGVKLEPSHVLFNYLGQMTAPGAGYAGLERSDTDPLTAPSPMELPLGRLMRWPEYVFDNLLPGHPYLVRLHFVESVCGKPGERVFDIWINGRSVLRRFDIVKECGARDTVVIKDFAGAADNEGRLTVNFVSYHNFQKATVNALEILKADEPLTDLEAIRYETCVPIYQVNAGGPRVPPFQEVNIVSGGIPFARTRPVDLSRAPFPAPLAVYDTDRYYYLYTELGIECQLYDRRLEFLVKYSNNMYRLERMRWFADTLIDCLIRLTY